jgi:hypothetical protein
MNYQSKSLFTLLFLPLMFLLFVQSCSMKKEGKLEIEAAILYKMGGAQPIARNEFYLLGESADEILKESNLKPKQIAKFEEMAKNVGISNTSKNYNLLMLHSANQLSKLESDYLNSVRILMEKHAVKTLKTDLQGKAQVSDLEPKTYYLYGYSETRGGGAIWNLPIDIKAGQNSITIDQSNAFNAN